MPSAVRREILAVIAIFMLSAFPVQADVQPAKLSLREAVSLSLKSNPDIRRAEDALVASESGLRIAGINTGISVGAGTSYVTGSDAEGSGSLFGKWEYNGLSGMQSQVEITPLAAGDDSGGISFSVKQPISRGKGALSTRADALADAVSSRLIREHQLFMARQTAVSGVIDAYFSAVLATEEIKVQERALAIAQEAADGARKRAEAGLVAEIEVSRAEIRVARTKDELNRKVQGARTATDKLMLAIGEGLGRSPELTTAVPEIAESFPDVDQAVIMAREGSVQLKIYDQRLQDNRRDLDISMDKLKPSLDAVVSYNSGNGSSAGSIFDDTSLVAGLQFSVPLDKRILREEKDGTARDLNLLKELRSFEADQVAGNVRAAYRARETADNTLRILGQNLETARENLRLAQRMVEEGLSSNRDVLEAQEALMTVESGLLAARLNFYLAGINLRKAMGEDLLKLKTVLQ